MMEPDSFCKLLSDSLGTRTVVNLKTILLDLPEFDSMGQVSLRAMADEHFNRIVTEEDIAACVTIADLHTLLSKPID